MIVRRPRQKVSCLVLLSAIGLMQSAPVAAQADRAFEPPPVLAGSALAPSALLTGRLYTVAEPVAVDGYFGRFTLDSKFGRFYVVGERMLAVRVHELSAIEALQGVQQGQAFQDALMKSASASVQFVQGAVTDPAKTVENVAQGIGSVLGRIGFLAESGVQAVAQSASAQGPAPAPNGSAPPIAGESAPSGFTGDPFGYNKARREWAKKLDIDPYTSNPVLKPLLDKAAAASFAGSFAVDTALGALSRPVNVAVQMETSVRDDVWNVPPLDLARANEGKLRAMGVAGPTTASLLRNAWFTPSLQTAFVASLSRLGSVSGVESVVEVASRLQGETRARFLLESLQMLAVYQERNGRFTRVTMSNLVPVGIRGDGTRVAAVAIDYAYWDRSAAEFARRRDSSAKRTVLLLAGNASNKARHELAKAGFTVATGLRI